MKVLVPLRTGTGQNDREHFRARARRVKAERHAVAWLLALHKPPAGPVTVTMTRISPGQGLDAHDNLRGSLKAPVDQVAEWLGRDDADPSITWVYEQRRSKPGEWLVSIVVETAFTNRGGQVKGVVAGCSNSFDLCSEQTKTSVQAGLPGTVKDPNGGCPTTAGVLGCGEESHITGIDRHIHANDFCCEAPAYCQTTSIPQGRRP